MSKERTTLNVYDKDVDRIAVLRGCWPDCSSQADVVEKLIDGAADWEQIDDAVEE